MKNFGAYSIQEFCSSSFFDSQSLKAIYALNQTNAPEVGFLDSVEYLKELIEKSYIMHGHLEGRRLGSAKKLKTPFF